MDKRGTAVPVMCPWDSTCTIIVLSTVGNNHLLPWLLSDAIIGLGIAFQSDCQYSSNISLHCTVKEGMVLKPRKEHFPTLPDLRNELVE